MSGNQHKSHENKNADGSGGAGTSERSEPIYVALCLELDLACQGATVDEAVENVSDAVDSFFEVASPSEIERRMFTTEEIERLSSAEAGGVFVTQIEVPFRKLRTLSGRKLGENPPVLAV